MRFQIGGWSLEFEQAHRMERRERRGAGISKTRDADRVSLMLDSSQPISTPTALFVDDAKTLWRAQAASVIKTIGLN